MEDSIRRLREVRRSSSQIFNQPQSVNGSSGFHSDDKIRHQLYLDAKAYIDEVSNVTLLRDFLLTIFSTYFLFIILCWLEIRYVSVSLWPIHFSVFNMGAVISIVGYFCVYLMSYYCV